MACIQGVGYASVVVVAGPWPVTVVVVTRSLLCLLPGSDIVVGTPTIARVQPVHRC